MTTQLDLPIDWTGWRPEPLTKSGMLLDAYHRGDLAGPIIHLAAFPMAEDGERAA